MQIQISWLLQNPSEVQIWIYTVCKGRVHPGSAGQGLIIYLLYTLWRLYSLSVLFLNLVNFIYSLLICLKFSGRIIIGVWSASTFYVKVSLPKYLGLIWYYMYYFSYVLIKYGDGDLPASPLSTLDSFWRVVYWAFMLFYNDECRRLRYIYINTLHYLFLIV